MGAGIHDESCLYPGRWVFRYLLYQLYVWLYQLDKAGKDTAVKCRKSGLLVLLLYTREFVAVELKKLSTNKKQNPRYGVFYYL